MKHWYSGSQNPIMVLKQACWILIFSKCNRSPYCFWKLIWSWEDNLSDTDQPNTKRNHANDPLEMPIGPITRARAKKLKEALNGLVHNIWSKMDLERLGTFKEHKGQPLIHLVQVQEESNSCGTRGWCVRPNTSLVRLVIFPNATRIKGSNLFS